ncbi:MAG: competence/damage-inducible protein A [Candidatus Eisenbacteria bacterium]|nr:competence/damage-inducible protein A [Candidatus Eisenbacteria bacterium]
MQIEIVSIGNEVLSGRTLDTNFAFLARALERVSVQVAWHTTVADSSERIAEALARALERADGVVMTGGLGPTPDDLTRKAVAAALGRHLQLDEGVLEHVRARAKRTGRKLPASFESQALLPRGAEVWINRHGTAPGVLLEHEGKPVILLPGIPQEMEALADEYVVPCLQKRSGRSVEAFTLRTAGVYETMLQERIGALPQGWPGATLAYLPSYFGVDLRVTVAGDDPAQVREVTGRAYAELKAIVRPVLYAEGERTMHEAVGEALLAKGWRLATAESCTGGLLAKRITDVPGASRWFERGFVTYSNAAKVELLGVEPAALAADGAVSAAVAEQMARGARERAQVEVAVAVTGIAGPGGGSDEKPVGTVFIAVASPGGAAARRYAFAGTRHVVRERSVQTALDLVRRRVLDLALDPKLE